MSNKKALELLILWILLWTMLQSVIEKEDEKIPENMVCIELPADGTWYDCSAELDENGRLIKKCKLMENKK